LSKSLNISNDTAKDFKLTAVGSIPIDWNVLSLEEIGVFLKGKGISKSEIKEEGFPCLTYGELYTRHNDVIKKFTSFISEESAKKSTQLKFGDILFAGSGETLKEIGKSSAFVNEFPAYAGGDIVILRQTSQNPYFLGYLLNNGIVAKQKHRLGQGHSVVHIYSSSLSKLQIPVPPHQEQQKIAEILSNWDQAISTTQSLINELKLRNKGLAQQLLTGKKRLKGFEGEWEETTIGKYAQNINIRNKGKHASEKLFAVTKKEGMIPMREQVKGKGFDNCKIVRKDWFAYNPMRVNIGSIAQWTNSEEVMVSADYVVFKCDEKKLLPKYLNHFRKTIAWENYMLIAGNGSVRVRIYFKDLSHLKLRLPPIKEQEYILEVLDNANKELTLYRQQLDTLKEQKKGLMQKLLTGEIRVKV